MKNKPKAEQKSQTAVPSKSKATNGPAAVKQAKSKQAKVKLPASKSARDQRSVASDEQFSVDVPSESKNLARQPGLAAG